MGFCGLVECGCTEGCVCTCVGVFAACAGVPTPAASPPRAFPNGVQTYVNQTSSSTYILFFLPTGSSAPLC
jgi:hypothetical protein